jgi:hypothetical protein
MIDVDIDNMRLRAGAEGNMPREGHRWMRILSDENVPVEIGLIARCAFILMGEIPDHAWVWADGQGETHLAVSIDPDFQKQWSDFLVTVIGNVGNGDAHIGQQVRGLRVALEHEKALIVRMRAIRELEAELSAAGQLPGAVAADLQASQGGSGLDGAGVIGHETNSSGAVGNGVG